MAHYDIKEAAKRLNDINRLRLLFSTSEEMFKYVHWGEAKEKNNGNEVGKDETATESTGNASANKEKDGNSNKGKTDNAAKEVKKDSNALGKIGGSNPFMKNAAYQMLCNYAQETFEVENLDRILTDFKDACDFYNENKIILSSLYTPVNNIKLLLDHFMANKRCNKKEYKAIFKEIERHDIDITLLLLIIIGIYPSTSKGKGSAIVKKYEEKMNMLIQILDEYAADNPIYSQMPMIKYYKAEMASKRSKNPIKRKANINFYVVAENVLQTFKNTFDEGRRDVEGRIAQDCTITSSLILDGCWYDAQEANSKETKKNKTYWTFEKLVNGFFMYCKEKTYSGIKYKRYEFYPYIEDGEMRLKLIAPETVAKLANIGKGEKIDTSTDIEWLYMDLQGREYIEDEDGEEYVRPAEMHLIHDFGQTFLKTTTLKKYSEEQSQKLLDDEKKFLEEGKISNAIPETDYHFEFCLAAITQEYLFYERKDGKYFKMPRAILNDDVTITDDCSGILTFNATGKTYINFVYINKLYDTDDPDNGITVTDMIEIPKIRR